MRYLLGIDLGTSGVKSILFDCQGRQIAQETAEYPLYQPENGWAEQEPEDWWRAVCHSIREMLHTSRISPDSICGIGLSGQMHGVVPLDREGRVLRRAILWCDGRARSQCEEITKIVGRQRLLAVAANPALPGFSAGSILWIRQMEPDVYRKCRHILLPKDYIRYRLTGVFATEASDASGTNLLDVPRRCWSQEILQALEIDPALLPEVHESAEITGNITPQAAEQTGLASGTPVVGGAGDNAASAIGTGVVENGKAFTTLGTSGVIFAHTDRMRLDEKGRVHTFCAAVPGAWTVMSCTLAAGQSLRWFRDQLYNEKPPEENGGIYSQMMKEAQESPVGANRLLFLPYLMGERSPISDANARGAFVGLSGIHTRADMLRAVVEGVSYSQRQCLDVLREMGVDIRQMAVCGGGAASPLWRQMLADLYGCPVKTMSSKEGAALGAAILAGVGTGVWPDIPEACSRILGELDCMEPDAQSSAAYESYYRLYCQLYPALADWYRCLGALS